MKPSGLHSFRKYLIQLLWLLLAGLMALPAFSSQVKSVRVWPSQDYSRVTIEHVGSIRHSHMILGNPDRLVVDLEGVELNSTLKGLVSKIKADDPYIAKVRVGQLRPNVVRFVFDLKAGVKPQIFSLPPNDRYKNRLVVDIYPLEPVDPIAALFHRENAANQAVKSPAVEPEAPKQEIAAAPKEPVIEITPARRSEKIKLSRMVTIVLDPGHGGEDPGAIGRTGSKEKNIVLAIAKRLKTKIEQEPNMRVVMTRNGDYFVPLHMRVQKARQVQADLFISIHADAFVEARARGASVFVLSEKGASSTSARLLARRENAADLIGGVNIRNQNRQVASILLDLSTTAQIKDSLQLGSAVLGEIGSINTLHKAQVEQAGFAVLKAPDIPSILVETAFISNPEEEAKLNNANHQDNVAHAILNGVKKYFKKNPPQSRNNMM